jgi:hypothetical protein
MRLALGSVLGSSILILVLVGVRAAQQPRDQANPVAEARQQHRILEAAMDAKLRHTHRLITSLAVEDFARMAQDAAELRRIGESALLKISPDVEYVKFCTEFSTVVEELGRRAKAHDLNGATLSFIRLTMNCVECHKHVRDKNLAGRNR